MSEPVGAETETETGRVQAVARSAVGMGVSRPTVEFVVVLCLSILLFRTFAAEAYIVPTGSMAPTLLGNHQVLTCPNCGYRLTLGLDDGGRAGRAVCSNCGQTGLEGVGATECNGDRVLVQKFLYDVRRPRRWEVAVFHFPGDPSQAYVKRVVGLPGESVRVNWGDVWADGKIARKTLKEQRAMRLPVYDHNFLPKDYERFPRWGFRRWGPAGRLESGWKIDGTRLMHEGMKQPEGPIDWAEYRHWDPDRNRFAAVHDFQGYNGTEVRGENAVPDLMIEAKVEAGAGVTSVFVRVDSGADRFVVEVPVGGKGIAKVTRNRRALVLKDARGGLAAGKCMLVEVSVMDHRLTAAVDGALLFEPVDYEDPRVGPQGGDTPIAIGVRGGTLSLSDLKISRDVYYTGSLAFSPRRAFGVDAPYPLGTDEFFVLGDNSAVSNDSRFWQGSPVVPGELFLGKPFLVHLPGQAVPLQVFGRSVYWVPDPREIRYIR